MGGNFVHFTFGIHSVIHVYDTNISNVIVRNNLISSSHQRP